MGVQGVELSCAHNYDGDESEEEHEATEEAEEVHWFLAEATCEPEGGEVEVAVDEAVEAELGLAVFAGLMLDYFLAYARESGLLGEVWYVAVHVAVDLDVLHHFAAVCLEAAVEVVEVVYAAVRLR